MIKIVIKMSSRLGKVKRRQNNQDGQGKKNSFDFLLTFLFHNSKWPRE